MTDPISCTSSSVSDIGPNEQRIFPDKHSPNDNVDRRTVRVTANVGQPNVTVYFKNIDVDDPSSDLAIDENDVTGPTGNDNRDGRVLGQPYPASAAGVLNATSATTDSGGVATVFFTVTRQPGDNFRIAASTDSGYLTGVVANGTGLKDAANNSLPTSQAKQSNLLTVWRKVHLEVDSMGMVADNFVTGFTIGKGKYVTSTPTWVEVYPTDGPAAIRGYLEEDVYKQALAPFGNIRISYGGRMVLDGATSLYVLDNDVIDRGTDNPKGSKVLVVSNGGDVYIHPNHPFKLYDDDDFNSSAGPPDQNPLFDGDMLEDVTFRPANNKFAETFSRLQASPNVTQNPYAEAYIEPDYQWAQSVPGMNDSDVPYGTVTITANYSFIIPTVNSWRDSVGSESAEFWVGYCLIGHQPGRVSGDGDILDADPVDLPFLGVAPPAVYDPNAPPYLTDGGPGTDSRHIPKGGIGNLIFIETMRDTDISTLSDFLIRTAPHELGHQFGLNGDRENFGIMSEDEPFQFVPAHINMMRWRVASPGQ